MPKRNTVARILRNHETNDLGCHLWLGPLDRDGYGICSWRGKSYRVHLFAWQHLRGAIFDGYEVDHKCKQRRCFNVEHLEPVTKAENLARAGLYKLSDEDVEAIREFCVNTNHSNATIAEAYGVDPSLISKSRKGKQR